MLGDNIRRLRKNRGYSQETLAERMHVVRQTISKWEKGLSVPDADMLEQMADLFEISVSELLDGSISQQELPEESADAVAEVAKQLAVMNDQLAGQVIRRRKNARRFLIGAAIALFLLLAAYVFCFWQFKVIPRQNAQLTMTSVQCELDGQTYSYGVVYDQNFQIYQAGGDAWIANHVNTEQYSDANVLLAQMEDYFTSRGGTYEVIKEEIVRPENQ